MRTALKVALILALIFVLAACSSSGGSGGNLTGGEATCEGPDCGRDEDDQNAAPQDPTDDPGEPTQVPPDQPTEDPEEKPTPPAPLECGGPDTAACPDGYRCVADPTTNCDPATGMDCRGICVLGEELPECGAFGAGSCPEGQACIDDPGDDCEGGPAVDCPGVCRPVSSGECNDDADCPVLDVRCTICADGSTSCPQSLCENGKCAINFEPCSEAQVCGDLSGLACEPGFECVDDPSDDCVDRATGCHGICVPEMKPGGCGGIAGMACPPGFECVDLPDDGCDPNDGGADCPAVCEQIPGRECTSDSECPSVPIPCSECPDGSEACPVSSCQNGYCNMTVPSCPMPPGCQSDADCPPGHTCAVGANGCDPATGSPDCGGVCIPGEETRACGGDAGDTCPAGFACIDEPGDDCYPDNGGTNCPGKCQLGPPSECGNCASVQAPCNLCPDGTYSCPHPECLNGMCTVYFNPCPDPGFCGGFAGFPCPPGLTCVDNPNDECDPNHGGADCEGMCIRQEEPLKCGGFAGEACPEGYECVDAPDDCDPDNGGADCTGFCRPTPGEACASDADCPVIAAPCQMCADGTAACPRSSCVNGQCQAEFPSCVDNRGEQR